jgi:hypothetical protein
MSCISLATPETAAVEKVASTGVFVESRTDGIPAKIATTTTCITSDLLVIRPEPVVVLPSLVDSVESQLARL